MKRCPVARGEREEKRKEARRKSPDQRKSLPMKLLVMVRSVKRSVMLVFMLLRDGPVNTKAAKWQVKIAESNDSFDTTSLTDESAKLSLLHLAFFVNRVRCFSLFFSLHGAFFEEHLCACECVNVRGKWSRVTLPAWRWREEKSANLPCHGLLIHSSSGCGQLVRQKWEKNSSNKEQWVAFLCPAPGHSAIEQWEKTNKRSLVTLTERGEEERDTGTGNNRK